MDILRELQGLGFEMPSMAYIVGVLLFGILGFVAYRHGRKQHNRLILWSGVGLMLYPYAVSDTGMLWAIGVALCALIAWAWRQQAS